jgi:hypothetical protein
LPSVRGILELADQRVSRSHLARARLAISRSGAMAIFLAEATNSRKLKNDI